MNQILLSKENYKFYYLKQIKFKILLYISIFSFIVAISFYYYIMYINNQKEIASKTLINSFNISTLYSDSSNYISNKVNNSPFVIGIIEIEKIKINYPILSNESEELLKISPCRFAGPMPNEIGNLCIAGHNYKDKRFFGRLKELDVNDKITIYDLSGNSLDYYVFEKTKINSKDISCTSQETSGEKIISLITCTNLKDERLLIKAKQMNLK